MEVVTPSKIKRKLGSPKRKRGRIQSFNKPFPFNQSHDLSLSHSRQQLQSQKQIVIRPPIQCPICLEQLAPNQLVSFSHTCNHSCCQRCLQEQINHCIKQFKTIKCWSQNCKVIIDKPSDHYHRLQPQQKSKYNRILNEHEILKHPNRRVCPKDGCNGYIITNKIPLKCIFCHQQFCTKCQFTKHYGSCDANTINFFKNNLNLARCSKCLWHVQKSENCNHMTCRCGNQFCYRCSANWSENHICVLQRFSQNNFNQEIQNNLNQEMNCDWLNWLLVFFYILTFLWFDILAFTVGNILVALCMIVIEIFFCYVFAITKDYRNQCLFQIILKILIPIWVPCQQEYYQQWNRRWKNFGKKFCDCTPLLMPFYSCTLKRLQRRR